MKFTFVYFVQCNMTYGAGKRVDRPCFINVFSLCFNSCHIELYIYRDFTGVINSNCWVPDRAAVRLTPTTMITVLIQSSQSCYKSPRYPYSAERERNLLQNTFFFFHFFVK